MIIKLIQQDIFNEQIIEYELRNKLDKSYPQIKLKKQTVYN